MPRNPRDGHQRDATRGGSTGGRGSRPLNAVLSYCTREYKLTDDASEAVLVTSFRSLVALQQAGCRACTDARASTRLGLGANPS
jgi:hypothetical protein